MLKLLQTLGLISNNLDILFGIKYNLKMTSQIVTAFYL